jgi:nucleotide-binding universal stress UspA family protein
MIQNIMVAVDGSDNNKVAVDYAIDLAKRYGAKLTAVTVFDAAKNEGMNYQKELVQETNDKNLAYAVAKASEMGYPLSTVQSFGNPAHCLLEISQDYDLIVCGNLGRSGFARLMLGSVSEKLVRFAHCPVYVARVKTD